MSSCSASRTASLGIAMRPSHEGDHKPPDASGGRQLCHATRYRRAGAYHGQAEPPCRADDTGRTERKPGNLRGDQSPLEGAGDAVLVRQSLHRTKPGHRAGFFVGAIEHANGHRLARLAALAGGHPQICVLRSRAVVGPSLIRAREKQGK